MALAIDQSPQQGEPKIPVFASIYYRALVPELADELEMSGLHDLAKTMRTRVHPDPTAGIVFRDQATHEMFEKCLRRVNRRA